MIVSSANFSAVRRRPCSGFRHFRDPRGLAIARLAVVVALVGLLAALSVPVARRMLVTRRSDAVLNDLRVFSDAFHAYVQKHGDWPAGAPAGMIPPGMEGYLRHSRWTQVSPIGGRYYWNPNSVQNGTRYRAVIVIATVSPNPVTTDRDQLLQIDHKIDDGDLATGNFQLGTGNYPLYIFER